MYEHDEVNGIGSPTNPARMEDCELIQCTGLKDRNGRLIYEGDIVRVYYTKCVVKWIRWKGQFLMASACTDPLSLEDDLSYQFGEVSESEIEVIGNVHENPELLEVENNEK